jgi:hypothetical protein
MKFPVSDIKDIKVILGGVTYTREWNQYARQNRLTYLLQDINKRIEWGYIDETYTNICHGVLWGVSTGRVNYLVATWLESRTLPELLRFLEEVHANCTTMLEVVFYLNKIHIEAKGYDKDMYTIYKRIKDTKLHSRS